MKTLEQLTHTDDPAWPLVEGWLSASPQVECLPRDPERADAALLALQVTTRSTMGAVVHGCGGLLVAHGWLRLLGSGHPRLDRSLPGWTEGKVPVSDDGHPGLLLVADDVLGGWFAVNGGAFGDPAGQVFYFAPDTLEWMDLDMGYSDFVAWALSPELDTFYDSLRWPGWETEVAALTGDQCLSFYPFLWADGEPLASRARTVVPVEEMFRLSMDLARQMSDAADPADT